MTRCGSGAGFGGDIPAVDDDTQLPLALPSIVAGVRIATVRGLGYCLERPPDTDAAA